MGAAVEAFGMSLNGARRVRFWNAVTAAFCGVLPALVLIRAYPARWRLLLAGFLIGLVWSNGFAYSNPFDQTSPIKNPARSSRQRAGARHIWFLAACRGYDLRCQRY